MRARLEALERREVELERFLTGVVGHDLRNPLAAITACVGVLNRMEAIDEPRRRCLEVIAGSSARLNRLLAELSDLVQAVGSGIPLRPAPAHLDSVCQVVKRQAEASHPGREVRCHPSGDGLGHWDAARLSQALRNLVQNALRYGEPAAPVELRWDGSEPDTVRIEVESHGPAIPEETLAELSQPFRGNRRPSGEREGLGLGIFFADHVAHGHGGSLQGRSEAGVTLFRLELPRHTRPH